MTGNDTVFLLSGIALGFDFAAILDLLRQRREERRDQEVIQRHADARAARAADRVKQLEEHA
jgi:hypothetical protein